MEVSFKLILSKNKLRCWVEKKHLIVLKIQFKEIRKNKNNTLLIYITDKGT